MHQKSNIIVKHLNTKKKEDTVIKNEQSPVENVEKKNSKWKHVAMGGVSGMLSGSATAVAATRLGKELEKSIAPKHQMSSGQAGIHLQQGLGALLPSSTSSASSAAQPQTPNKPNNQAASPEKNNTTNN